MDRSQHDLKLPDDLAHPEPLTTGAEFRARRRAAGRKQREIAEAVGVSGSYLSLIETGDRPMSQALAERLLAALDELPAKEHRDEQLLALGSAVVLLVEGFRGGDDAAT